MPLHRIFFYFLLIALPTQLGYHAWPSWAMVLGRRVDYLSPTLYITDVLIFLIVIFWLGQCILRAKPEVAALVLGVAPRTIKLVLLFGLLVVSNIFFAANRMVAVYGWMKVLEYVLLGVYIIKTKPAFSKIIFCLSIGVFYSSIIAIVQFVFQRSIGGPFWFLGERTFHVDTPGIARTIVYGQEMLRAYGTFPHPNVLGGFLAVLLPVIAARKNHTFFYKTTLLLGIVALVMTFSRSAWIVCLLDFIFLWGNDIKKKIIVGIIFFILIFNLFSLAEESFVVRQQLNTAAIKIFFHSPFVGVGLGNFLVELPKFLPSRQIYFLQPVHNIYLLILAETGIVGFILFVCILWKSLRRNKLLFVGMLLLGFVDHYFLTLQQGQLLLVIFLSSTIEL